MSLIHCNLRVLMAEKGLNIQKVKDRTTLSRTTISNLYNNYGSGIQFDTLLELCELLDCTPGDLLSLIKIDTDFKVVSSEEKYRIEETHMEDEEGNGHDYISLIQINLNMNCFLSYEGKNHDLDFKAHISYHMNEKKEMNQIDIELPTEFHEKLEKIIIPHAKDYFLDELSNFLIDWGLGWFSDEEIENITNLSINFGFLDEQEE